MYLSILPSTSFIVITQTHPESNWDNTVQSRLHYRYAIGPAESRGIDPQRLGVHRFSKPSYAPA